MNDLVTQMHNARGAFYRDLQPCQCGTHPVLQQSKPVMGQTARWWIACPKPHCLTGSVSTSAGEASFNWNTARLSAVSN